jgi:hypothetical protein
MNSIPCNIVLLPSEDLEKRALTMSANLQKYHALFQLTSTGPFPHASLYMTQLKESDIGKVKTLLVNIAANVPPIALTATQYSQAEGYIDVEYTRNVVIDHLQMAVVEAINPIRDDMREKDKARMFEATGKIRENFEQYGYDGVGELFRPHLTFTRFAGGQAIEIASLPKPDQFSGEFAKLGLFERGAGGTCMRKIAEFELGTQA